MPDIEAARRELEEALGASGVLSDPLSLALYRRDASMVEGGCALVAFPTELAHIVACMRIADDHDLAVVPRGSGTGLAGGATPIDDALVVCTTKMDRILDVRPADRLAWVEPGVLNLDLADAVAPMGLTFAPDPASQQSCTIGGNVATNAGGPRCLAHGVTADHVMGLDVVLPDGSVERLGSEAPAAAGYDLRGLLIGSEGTLGIVAAACVRLTPIAPSVSTLLLGFPTAEDCAAAVSDVIASGIVPTAMEMMDRGIVEAVERFARAGYPSDAGAVLLVEVDGTPGAVEAQARLVEDVARRHDASSLRTAAEGSERTLLWKGRKSAFGALGQIAPHYYLHDVVVPRARLVEAVAGFAEIGRRHGLAVTCLLHAGDGNLHPHFHFDQRMPGALERVLAASEDVIRLAVELGGTLSGEHGIGLEKRDFMPLVFTEEDLRLQACVRSCFDPDGRMNPRKVLPDGARCAETSASETHGGPGSETGHEEGPWS